ncbi:hypothetical protein AOXY_G5082, partial [Acipenser oxyrinchus oxyrinchus]
LTLPSIYLAVICKSSDVQQYGNDKILEPLLKDIDVLEQQGLFIQLLGASVKGSVLYVSADNLGAHSLAGFQESFNVEKFCRFCLASHKEIQTNAALSANKMLFRVIMTTDDIRKIYIDSLPETVDKLHAVLKDKLQLEQDFILQYEDPDFGNELCNLTNISDVPAENATLKVIFNSLPESDLSDFTLDTASISSSPSASESSSVNVNNHSQQWPATFIIPSFSYDAEYRLRQGNEDMKRMVPF